MKVAILGFGVVGSGTYDVIEKNKENIKNKKGIDLSVKYIVDIRDFSGTEYENIVVSDFSIVENDPEVTVVAEVIGGTTFAFDFTKRALMAKKHVVTSNKELVAIHGAELLEIARQNNVNYMFEASVGGGIPVIRPLVNCLCANEIEAITGIVNGTTNYILTQMIEENKAFDVALLEAQQKGYAEQNPDADILGIDAQRKICILSNLAFSKEIEPKDVFAQGITEITLEDIKFALKDNKVVKLLARTVKQDGKIYTFVAPHLVDKSNMLSGVRDVYNAVMVTGNAVDDVMFYGKGAGKDATASAVVADIVDVCMSSGHKKDIFWEKTEKYISNIEELSSEFMIRFEEKIDTDIKIKTDLSESGKTCFITEKMSMVEIKNKLQKFENYSCIRVL